MPKNRREPVPPRTRPYKALTGIYTVDPAHSTIGLSVRHAMITNVRGRFTDFEGLLRLDGSHPTRSQAYVSVRTGSLDTSVLDRDAHVVGPDFLDCALYPLMTFRSSGIVPTGGDRFRVYGELMIKGVELPVGIDLRFGGAGRDPKGKHRVGFEGTAILHRSDWGLTWNTALETGGVLLSDTVRLTLGISAVRLDRAQTG
ncbi:YceI family protein [Streptomyces wuyuanensis]|uniref:YceI family protein n=1 Tax=Streptomyces wuyuanensis TaxID=1196353 RepID=UPI00380A6279